MHTHTTSTSPSTNVVYQPNTGAMCMPSTLCQSVTFRKFCCIEATQFIQGAAGVTQEAMNELAKKYLHNHFIMVTSHLPAWHSGKVTDEKLVFTR